MTLAFTFDARFCSGCKACQAACKDKNNLPPGVLWRRVVEVAGGAWQQHGQAWENTVFGYNFSIACNHCIHPKCAGVCPTNAYSIRDDGIVLLDAAKCTGCGYCAWACPYGAPQYDSYTGHMTKCNGCFEDLAQGLAPACVAACPLRILDYQEVRDEDPPAAHEIRLWERPSSEHPYPLPVYSHTGARLSIKQHPSMERTDAKFVANREEIQPRPDSAWQETPLLLFTLLAQMAAGGVLAMTWMFQPLWLLAAHDTTRLQLLPWLLIGLPLGTGMLASFGHLGTKRNAWRALANLPRSRLSREILFLGLFGGAWLLTALTGLTGGWIGFEWIAVAAILGIGLVHNMAEVYRLPAVPAWNTWRTNAGFLASALLLGISSMAPLLAYESTLTGIRVFPEQWALIGGLMVILMLFQLGLMQGTSSRDPLVDLRIGLLSTGIILAAVSYLQPILDAAYASALLFLIVLAEESLGRWLFYRSRTLVPTMR